MTTRRRSLVALLIATGLALVPLVAGATTPSHDRIVNAVPSASTPAVNDGTIYGIAQVGSTMVVGGTFTNVTSPGGGSAVSRRYVFAFDAATGQVSSSFAPSVNGEVDAVLPGPTAGTVYLTGSFTTVNGVSTSHVALLDVSNGERVAGFAPAATNGKVNTAALVGNRLILGGNFTTAGGAAHGGIASINATTGALDGYVNLQVSGHHNDTGSGAQGAIGVRGMSATHAGDRLVIIGNFKQVNGSTRDQIALVDLGSSSAALDANWRTQRYQPYCFNWAFDTYIRGVDVAPDDSYFVVTATGGHNSGTLCDTAARWEFSATGQDVQPTWVSDSGGDTLWGVAVTEKAVYVGGHQRWMNNALGSDYAAPGAVARPGLAALDVQSGEPLSWNPGRNPRGAGAYVVYATTQGLWIGSDTDWIGNFAYRRPKLAYFPLSGGETEASDNGPALPGSVYLAGSRTVDQGNVLFRVDAGGPQVGAVDGGPDWAADDADQSPYRNSGSNAAGWDPSASRDSSLPASTPTAIFDSERWSPSDNPRMSWSFPATSGLPLQVRLFFANRYTGTSSEGSRVFDVDLDGTRVLNHFDIVAAAGDQTGMMKSFDITSDGTVNIDFSHEVENPLIDGIEIVRRDLPPPTQTGNSLRSVQFDGSTAGTAANANDLGVDWTQVRGAFIIGSTLYYGNASGGLYKRSFSPTGVGPATLLDPYHDPRWDDVNTGSGQTYRGATSAFYDQTPNLSGMFYKDSRIYYTRQGSSHLFWRWFNVDSGIVGPDEFTADGGLSWTNTAGMFVNGSNLFFANAVNGNLTRVGFVDGSPSGSPVVVDTANDWRARALFVGQGAPANQPPRARFTSSCVERACSFDGSASSDPESGALGYQWTFGDGTTGTGATASHTFGADGTYTVTLTVTDPGSLSDSVQHAVSVTSGTTSGISYVAEADSNANTSNPAVTVPSEVQTDDQMVLFASYGYTTSAPATPSGWTLVGQRDAHGMQSYVWTRRAVAGDAGSTVAVPTDDFGKAVLVLAAYRGVDAGTPIVASASSTDSATDHVTPTITVPANAWLLQLWSDKSSSTTSWTLPGGVVQRALNVGSGSGRVSAVLADSGGAVPAGPAGGLTASTNASSGRAIAWSLALGSS